MSLPRRALLIAEVLFFSALFSAFSLHAQTADPSGHWEGSVLVQSNQRLFQIDLARNADSGFSATISIPAENLKGLPAKVTIEGRVIRIQARSDQPLTGTLSDDGKAMSGDLSLEGTLFPFSLTRTGDARAVARPTSAPIAKAMEGTWNGTLGEGGGVRLVLTMANHPDGTATGSIVNLDEGGLEIPVTIASDGSRVTLEATAVAGSYTATLSPDGTELVGTFSENGRSAPLNFRRERATEGKKQ